MPARVPAYFDGLIAAHRAGRMGRDVHLGYWDRPPPLTTPCAPGEFMAAQQRLTERMAAVAGVQRGQRVLDVGCGFGGTLAEIAAVPQTEIVGVNLDHRQLELCAGVAPPPGGSLVLVEADACALPFASGTFDHVLCIEAMFHFRCRRRFLAEAARLLKSGGGLSVTDILLRDPGRAAPWDTETMMGAIQRDYGPWPDPWAAAASLQQWAATESLELSGCEDWTSQTLPSHRTVAADGALAPPRNPHAGDVLRWLHSHAWLSYPMMTFRRR